MAENMIIIYYNLLIINDYNLLIINYFLNDYTIIHY